MTRSNARLSVVCVVALLYGLLMGYNTCATHYLMRGLHGSLPVSITASSTPENLAELTFIIAVDKPAWYVTFTVMPVPQEKIPSAQLGTAPRVHIQNSQRFLRRFSTGSSFFAASSAATCASQRKLARKCQHRLHQYPHLKYTETCRM